MGIVHYADNYEDKWKLVLEEKLPKYIKDNFGNVKQQDDSDDDDSSSPSVGSFDKGFEPVFKTESPTERYAPLLKALGHCPALNLGFHTKEKKNLCFCPFGYKMKNWRKSLQYNIPDESLCSHKGDRKNSTKGFCPYGLLKHLKYKAAHDSNHAIVYKFLECLYEDYTVKGLRHKYFYPTNSNEYKSIEDAENQQQDTSTAPHSQFAITTNPP